VKSDHWLAEVQSRIGAINPGRFSSDIELHSGEVRIESEFGRGTAVFISFPAARNVLVQPELSRAV